MNRLYTFESVVSGDPPKERSKIIRYVKSVSLLEFDDIESC